MSQTHEEPTADSTEPFTQEPSEASVDSVDAPVQPGDSSVAAHSDDHDHDVEDHDDQSHDHDHDHDHAGANVGVADVADDAAAGLAAEVESSDLAAADVVDVADDAAAGLAAEVESSDLAAADVSDETADDASDLAADDASDLAADDASDEALDLASDEQDDMDGAEPAGSGRRSRRAPSRDLLEKEGEIAADFLETLLDICDLDGDLDVDIDGDRAAVSIVDSDEGRVPRRLVGTDGKVLDALQELTRLAVYSSTGERSRLILDIAGHRSERRTTLVAQAQAAIAAVRETGEKQALDPMSAFERKIVHDEVLAGGLHSESDGVEPRRYVVVLPV